MCTTSSVIITALNTISISIYSHSINLSIRRYHPISINSFLLENSDNRKSIEIVLFVITNVHSNHRMR